MRRTQVRFLVLLTFLTLFLPVTIADAQGTPVTVRFSPASSEVAAGEIFEVAVEVVNVQEIYGFSVAFTFDPSVLQVQDADPTLAGVQVGFGTLLEPGVVIVNNVDNVNGTVEFAMTQLNPSTPKNGTGNLIVISFLGGTAGQESPLELVFVQLAAPRGVEIPAEALSGTVQIVASLPPGPTNTPVPTQPAGTTLPSPTPPAPVTPVPTSTDRPMTTTNPPTATVAPTATEQLAAGEAPPTASVTPSVATVPTEAKEGNTVVGATGETPPADLTPTANSAGVTVAEAVRSTAVSGTVAPSEEGAAIIQDGNENGGNASPTETNVIGEGIEPPASTAVETAHDSESPWAVALLALAGIGFIVALIALGLRRRYLPNAGPLDKERTHE
jgi:hypothetical protein